MRPHGNVNTYNAGCHCADCRAAWAVYQRSCTARRAQRSGRVYRPHPNAWGERVTVDTDRLRALVAATGLPQARVARNMGLDPTQIAVTLRRGRCTLRTLDLMSSYLGRHMSELEAAS